MFVQKNISWRGLISFSGFHMIWLLLWATLVAVIHEYVHGIFFNVPWLPLSVIGTAVAFYIGFKNNQAYDRLWEARKIWGAIVNDSRSWGAAVRGFVTDEYRDEGGADDSPAIHRRLILRHIAWLYALRSQLLIPTPWEHVSQNKHVSRLTKRRMDRISKGALKENYTKEDLTIFIDDDEFAKLMKFKNMATQIIDHQSQDLKDLKRQGYIDDFRHMELQQLLTNFYTHQGKCERIKKFPLPRQYGGMSFIFVGIFIFLLPFGMVSEFHELGHHGAWWSIPFTALVSWVYLMMELVGDYSENPFEGLGNDIPMFSLCRTIEIDLKEMIGEEEIPAPVEAKNGILM